MKIIDYVILEARDVIHLAKNVRSKMDEGYQPLGGVISIPASYGDNFINQRNNIAQAMVLYEGD